MNLKITLIFALLLEMDTLLCAADTGTSVIAGKRIAIVYEDEQTPEALFNKAYKFFSELTHTGELKTVEIDNDKNGVKIINIQTPTDDRTIAGYEHIIVKNKVEEKIQKDNLPYSGRFQIFSKNIMFGDKSLGYVVNPYRGCYNHMFLAKGLEKSGYQLVEANETPDLTLKIGIDICMTENEYKEYIQKNTALKLKKQIVSSDGANISLGNDLMRAGSSAKLGTPSGGGNAGLAVAGVGLALNMASWMMTKTPQERDVIRYHVTFSGKEKNAVEFYPIAFTKATHKESEPVQIGSYRELENLVFSSFLEWDAADKTFSDNLPAVLKEKDILKLTEQAVSLKK